MRILLLLFLAILQVSSVKGATSVDQFNRLIATEYILGGRDKISAQKAVFASKQKADNLALIYVTETPVLISSSIINEKLYKDLSGGDSSEYQPAISVIDLLYLYAPDFGGSLIAGTFSEKLTSARENPNRKILIDMLKEVLGQFIAHNSKNPDEIFENVPKRYVVAGELEKFAPNSGVTTSPLDRLIRFVASKITADLSTKKNAIINFLQRLKLYANSIEAIPDTTLDTNGIDHGKDILSYTSHHQVDKQNLINEIDLQLGEINLEEDITSRNLAKSIVNLARLIRGPNLRIGDIWRVDSANYPKNHNPNQYVSAITHTEQMVDWLSKHFGGNILVKISGKAPCVKCSHYIQYTGVTANWNRRTIVGYTVGWSGRNPMSECMQYRYPVKVFNARRVNATVISWTLSMDFTSAVLIRKLGEALPGTYAEGEFGDVVGINKSHCYAIENVDRYKGQLTMQKDGSITQTLLDRKEGPLLVHFEEAHPEMPYYGEFIGE